MPSHTKLNVENCASCGADPMEMSYLLGIAGGCLTAVLLLACLCIYAIRARKCCFKGKFYTSSICCVKLNEQLFLHDIMVWIGSAWYMDGS